MSLTSDVDACIGSSSPRVVGTCGDAADAIGGCARGSWSELTITPAAFDVPKPSETPITTLGTPQ